MPELPEVETVRAGLAATILGAKVTGIRIHDSRSLRKHAGGAEDFKQQLIGTRISDVVRRGKFLWLPLDSGESALVGHLGMSGQMLVRTPKFEADKLNRVTLELRGEKKYELRFVDQRIFGSLAIEELIPTSDGGNGGLGESKDSKAGWTNLIPASAFHIARDALDPLLDIERVVRRMRKSQSGIKRLLLDQNLISGIGNIYADESLWWARLHYDRPGASISIKRLEELIGFAQKVLSDAVAKGGTSFDEQYKNVNGESGYFSQDLYAYGQTDLPCARCQTPIRRASWANRSSHFCPRCQRPSGR